MAHITSGRLRQEKWKVNDYLFWQMKPIDQPRRANAPLCVIELMTSSSTIATILHLLRADTGTTQAQVDATERFFAQGFTSAVTRVTVDCALLLTTSASARLIGVSRVKFREIQEVEKFTEHYLPGEKWPRFEKIQLIEYSATQRSAAPKLQLHVA